MATDVSYVLIAIGLAVLAALISGLGAQTLVYGLRPQARMSEKNSDRDRH